MDDTKNELTHQERCRQFLARYARSMETNEPRHEKELAEITALLGKDSKAGSA